MKEELKKLLEEAKQSLAELKTMDEAEALRIKFLGKKGAITEILRGMKDLDPEERKSFGQAANETKAEIEQLINARKEILRSTAKKAKLIAEAIDVTEPAVEAKLGASQCFACDIDENAVRIAKENTELLEKINQALKELTDDGTIAAIVNKYIPAEG